jgi:ubiquinone/menaquinone biosynthesis C-methylase UbiE
MCIRSVANQAEQVASSLDAHNPAGQLSARITMNLRELYKDSSATRDYWEDNWAGRDYDAMLKFELGNFTHRATIDKFIKQCQIHNGDSVLDVGCGWGRIIVGMLKRLPQVEMHGVDVSKEAIMRGLGLMERVTGHKPDMRVAPAEALPFDAGYFDAVISTRTWQYVTDPAGATREVSRVLKSGGRATIMAPNARNPIRARTYHTQLLTVEQIAAWIEGAGMEVTGYGTIVFAPPSVIRFSDRSLWVHIERILERTPCINRIGGLAWASGRKT